MAADPLDLITLARAKQAFAGLIGAPDLTLGANEQTTLQNVLTACSVQAIRECRRNFVQATYDEIHNRTPYPMLLRNFPVISVAFIRDTPTAVLTISQPNTTTNQYATVEILATGLRLKRTASGVTTTVTAGLDFAGNVTITALAAAVNALGVSWLATVLAPYGNFPSIDLWVSSTPLAPVNLRDGPASLSLHVHNYGQLALTPANGRLQLPDQPNDRFTVEPVISLRVQYSAGYATIPEDLQDAIASWAASIMFQLKRDPATGNTFASGLGSSFRPLPGQMPEMTQRVLRTYRAPSILV